MVILLLGTSGSYVIPRTTFNSSMMTHCTLDFNPEYLKVPTAAALHDNREQNNNQNSHDESLIPSVHVEGVYRQARQHAKFKVRIIF